MTRTDVILWVSCWTGIAGPAAQMLITDAWSVIWVSKEYATVWRFVVRYYLDNTECTVISVLLYKKVRTCSKKWLRLFIQCYRVTAENILVLKTCWPCLQYWSSQYCIGHSIWINKWLGNHSLEPALDGDQEQGQQNKRKARRLELYWHQKNSIFDFITSLMVI